MKLKFFKLCFHQERLFAWVKPLNSGCSASYFTIVWLMMNWGGFLNGCTSGVMIFCDFCREVNEQSQLCQIFMWNAISKSFVRVYFTVFCPCFVHPQVWHFAIPSSEEQSKSSRNTSWSQVKMKRRAKRSQHDKMCQEGTTWVSRDFSICWWSV